MHINVNDILTSELGQSRSYTIDREQPNITDLELAEPISGYVELTKSEHGISLLGEVQTAVSLECHRCLRKFVHPVRLKLSAQFSAVASPEAWPIAADQTIDIAPVIREEALVGLPIKQVCGDDCAGLCDVCGERLTADHEHPDEIQALGTKIIIKD